MFVHPGHPRAGGAAGGRQSGVLRPGLVLREEALSGIAARIVQHENDHLDGVMIPDYVPVLKKALLQGKLKEIGAGKVPSDYPMRFPGKRNRR